MRERRPSACCFTLKHRSCFFKSTNAKPGRKWHRGKENLQKTEPRSASLVTDGSQMGVDGRNVVQRVENERHGAAEER